LLILGQKYISQNNDFNFIVVWFIPETVGEFPKEFMYTFYGSTLHLFMFLLCFQPYLNFLHTFMWLIQY